MFKLGQVPSPRAEIVELADYLELECLRQPDSNASVQDVLAVLGRVSEDFESDSEQSGLEEDDLVGSLVTEFQLRGQDSAAGYYKYPFAMNGPAGVLRHLASDAPPLYVYTLLATRMNMQSSRVHAGINGTDLFERVCECTAKEYFGPRSKSHLFGTARRAAGSSEPSFAAAVSGLCSAMRQGLQFQNRSGGDVQAQDDGLDVVVWTPFSDELPGTAIGFGQCKTGATWDVKDLSRLQALSFVEKWMANPISAKPLVMFFSTERLARQQVPTYSLSQDRGIVLFDRCRVLDFCPRLPDDLGSQVRDWVSGALSSNPWQSP